MAKVMPGRYTAQIDDPFVVFLIGMRINKFFAFSNRWLHRPPRLKLRKGEAAAMVLRKSRRL